MNASICKATRKSLELYKVVSSGVSHLLCLRRPLAVPRFVALAVVNAINAPTFWCHTHISKKVLKRVYPPITNGDSTASIVTKLPELRIEAALFHAVPSSVCFGWLRPPMPVFSPDLQCKTPTRSGCSVNEVKASGRNLFAAFALAKELFYDLSTWFDSVWGWCKNFKPSKSLADDALSIPHNIRLLFVVPRSRLLQSARAFLLSQISMKGATP